MTVELSPRLKTVASFIEGVTLLCDVGSDHAYLPVYAIQQGLISSAIAGEVVKERLVLQPNVAEHLLRQWLVEHHYEILEEVVVEDHHRLYEIIVAEKREQSVPLTATQIKFGTKLIENPTDLVIRKWERQLRKIEEILEQLKQSKEVPTEKVETFNHQYLELKGLIDNANR